MGISKIFEKENGQALTEYVLTLASIILIVIPVLKYFPIVLCKVFNKILRFYSLKLDELYTQFSRIFPF